MIKFTFIDVESVWDEHLHEAYREIDPRGAAKQKRNDQHRHRLPCKRIVAAAAFDLEVDQAGAISIGGLSSWTEHEHGDEREVVACLFAHLRERPDTHVVTYSGLAAEVPLLTLAAMHHELILPEQLRSSLPKVGRPPIWRKHIDLALELKGQGREWAHLSELGLRLGLPGALFAGKPNIGRPCSADEWHTLRQRVGLDCVLTAIVALAFWRANGRLKLDQVAMLHNVADWAIRRSTMDGPCNAALLSLRTQMFERMGIDLDKAA